MSELEDRWNYPPEEETNTKEWNGNEESPWTWGISSREAMYMSLSPNRRRGERMESLFLKVISENCSNLGRDVDIQAYEANRFPHIFDTVIFSKAHYNKTV